MKIASPAKSTPMSNVARPRASRTTHPQHQLIRLQHSVGNFAASQLLRRHTIQAKLTIGPTNDRFEQEADRVAEQVMRMSDPSIDAGTTSVAPSSAQIVQRGCSKCQQDLQRKPVISTLSSARPIQRLCPACEEELQRMEIEEDERLQRKEGSITTPQVTPGVESAVRSLDGGRPLSNSLRTFFEPRFGVDFSHVRVHTDSNANRVARSINARAFTIGSNIAFASSAFSPANNEGRRLLAHELTHVVQQSGGATGTIQRHECRDGEGPPAAVPDPEGAGIHPLVYRGTSRRRSRNPTVGDAQELLNEFLRALDTPGTFSCKAGADMDAIERIRDSLSEGQDPLVVDCRFGPNTEKVTKMFQRCVFPGQPDEWDGKIGPTTWPELEALRPAPPPPPPPPCPTIVCPFAPTQPTTTAPAPPPEPQRRNPGIASGALCRGACGPDCPDSCRPLDDLVLCVHDPVSDCHAECTYTAVISCFTHEGCRVHDNCYDVCAAGGETDLCGCPVAACAFGTVCANPCHCRCDEDCCDTHSSIDCGLWSQGSRSAPSDGEFIYSGGATAGPSSRGLCP